MSLAGDRAAIKAALDTVTGVTGHTARPPTPSDGDAWPLSGGLVRDDASGLFVAEWRVIVFLPQDEQAASEWMDENYEEITDALESAEVGYVDRIEPVEVGSGQYGIAITMRAEG